MVHEHSCHRLLQEYFTVVLESEIFLHLLPELAMGEKLKASKSLGFQRLAILSGRSLFTYFLRRPLQMSDLPKHESLSSAPRLEFALNDSLFGLYSRRFARVLGQGAQNFCYSAFSVVSLSSGRQIRFFLVLLGKSCDCVSHQS